MSAMTRSATARLRDSESTAATLLAIRQVLGEAGIPVDDDTNSERVGLTAEQVGKIAIEALTGRVATFGLQTITSTSPLTATRKSTFRHWPPPWSVSTPRQRTSTRGTQ